MKKVLLPCLLCLLLTPVYTQTVTDIDGNVYKTVVIGNQEWMAENLRTRHYADGTDIPQVKTTWSTLTVNDKAFCWYNNDSTLNAATYGALYTWAAAMNGASTSNTIPSNVQGVAPTGWHIPSDAEWHALVTYLDAGAVLSLTESANAGAVLKESGITHWMATGGTNTVGFNALPGGRRMETGVFTQLGYNAMWWTTTISGVYAMDRTLYYNSSRIDRAPAYKNVGYAVRCVKNAPTKIDEINSFEKIELYPTPAVDKVFITATESMAINVQILDLTGKVIFEKYLTDFKTGIDIRNFQKGIYMVNISTGENMISRKLIKN